MAKVVYDYTAAEIQADIDNEVDFELEHDEDRIVVEIPTGMLNRVVQASDGVLIAPGHQCKLEDYMEIIAENANGSKVLAYLRVNGSMAGTGIRGMKRNNIKSLIELIPSGMKNITDADIISDYFPTNEEV
jgi:hypothetical protein